MTIDAGDTAGKEIERVARAMCKADGVEPPDQLVAFVPLAVNSRGFTFIPSYEGATGPAWQAYTSLARAAVAELRQQSKIELVSAGRSVPYGNWLRDLREYAYALLDPNATRDDVRIATAGLRNCLQEAVE